LLRVCAQIRPLLNPESDTGVPCKAKVLAFERQIYLVDMLQIEDDLVRPSER
jgi:hypothetical protein